MQTPPLPYPPEPVWLSGQTVRLDPMSPADAQGLAEAATDGRLWELWYTTVPAPEQMASWIDAALTQQSAGKALPFTVREAASGRIVGSTRYMNIEGDRRRMEIGTTWYARRVQKTALNTEAKSLLLAHAFERLACIAVELRTHSFNFASRAAIEKLGARQDGILRQHMVMSDGTLRDTVVFSILDREWPTVRTHLAFRLARLRGEHGRRNVLE